MTSIILGTHTLSTSISTGIDLTTNSAYLSPFTVTSTGTVSATNYGVYGVLSSPELLNEGVITGGVTGVHFTGAGATVVNAGSTPAPPLMASIFKPAVR